MDKIKNQNFTLKYGKVPPMKCESFLYYILNYFCELKWLHILSKTIETDFIIDQNEQTSSIKNTNSKRWYDIIFTNDHYERI